MSKVFTPKDCHQLMNLLVREGTGQASLSVVDTSSFVSAGETLLATGYENVFNTINLVYGRLIVASRSYKARLTLMDAISTEEYSHLIRKISFYSKGAKPSGNFNTDLFLNLADGFTNGQNKDSNGTAQSAKSQWEQNTQPSVTVTFGGSDVWENCITLYENQVQQAFRDESEFAKFTAGYIQEHANDFESQREAWNRMCLLNKIGQAFDMNGVTGSAINLTYAYNQKYGTNRTSAQLRTTYLKEFAQFFVSEFKKYLEFMGERSTAYHWSMPKVIDGVTHNILRHTTLDNARVYLYSPLWKDVEARVLPEIFNTEYLDIDTQYQPITYWQSNNSDADRPKVKVVPAVVDTDTSHTTTYGTQIQGAEVDLDYVVGIITDRDGLLTDFQIETTRTTPVEARKGYRNTWQIVAKNCICDPTEKCLLFYMADPSPTPTPTTLNMSLTKGNVTYQNAEPDSVSEE